MSDKPRTPVPAEVVQPPEEWRRGDPITADKLNAMQRGMRGVAAPVTVLPRPRIPEKPVSMIWQVVWGKTITPAGVEGARKVSVSNWSTLTLPEVTDFAAPVGLANGVGLAVNAETGLRALFYNAGTIPRDLWIGHMFICPSLTNILVTGYSDKYQKYLIPIAAV